MKNEDELERLVREKEFGALTESEKKRVLETIGSEEEYEAMRKIELAMSDSSLRSTLEPDKEILRALHHRMRKQRVPFEWGNILHVKIPAYAAMLVTISISGLVVALRPQPPAKYVSQQKVESPAIRIDTVFITKTDTVVRDRIVYRQVNLATSPRALDPSTLVHQKQPSGSGVSMKEKEELNKLLVSGSD